MMRGIVLIILILVALGVVSIVVWPSLERASVSDNNVPKAGNITVRGEVVCLPHKDTEGPHTLECAFGIIGDDGNYYALRDETAPTGPPLFANIDTGARVEARGSFTPGEDDVYQSVGVLTVREMSREGEEPVRTPATEATHSDGTITFTRPDEFGLAISAGQVLVDTAVPPCVEGFTYCLYYLGDAYEHTNFESAGLSISSRAGVATEAECLETPPEGYADLKPEVMMSTETYVMSVFRPIRDAGTGQFASGEVYRLFISNTCYALTIRIGESQYEQIKTDDTEAFSDADRTALLQQLRGMIEQILLTETGETLTLPS